MLSRQHNPGARDARLTAEDAEGTKAKSFSVCSVYSAGFSFLKLLRNSGRGLGISGRWILAAGWLLAALNTPWICAAKSPFAVDSKDTESGLPEMSVIALTQTRDGYLWLGTGDGLARFDGVHFKRYEEANTLGLSGGKVVKLYEDRKGNLWVGTETAGVFLMAADGAVKPLALGGPANEGPLVSIGEDCAGNVWFTMAKGQLYYFADGKANLVASSARGLLCEDSGLVWIGAPDGRLLAFGPISNSPPPRAFVVSYEIPVGKLDYLLARKGGGYWRLAGGRIQKWKVDRIEQDLGPYPWHPGVPVLAACEDPAGNLVVGTFGDGVYWQGPDGAFSRVDGLPHSFIWTMTMDHEGNLWVGSNGGGLNRVKRQSFSVVAGTEGSTVQSVCEDAQGGVWIGHNSERLDYWNTNSLQSFTDIWSAAPHVAGLTRFSARTVFVDRSDQVWLGGATELDRVTPPVFYLDDHQFRQSTNGEIWAIFQDHAGVLWLGTQAGLARKEQGGWKMFTTRDGLSSDAIRALAEDKDGALWVGTESGGLNRFRDGKFEVFRRQAQEGPPSDHISSLYVDAQGVLWMGTSLGLGRFAQGLWTRYTTSQGLASDKIGYLLEDGRGYLWIGSNAGLMRVAKESLNWLAEHHLSEESIPFRVFGTSDGLPTSECSSGSQPGAARTRSGTLCFPTIRGLVVVDPAKLQVNTNPPPVLIEAVRIDNVLQTPDSLRMVPLQSVTVPAGKESLEISYTSLNLSAPDKGFFKYLMEGHEKTWTERSGNVRYARYSKLPPGHYWFRVRACNEDGVWNEAGASLGVTVLPPFWQTWWFLATSTLAVLGLIVGSVHYISTQRLQRQLAFMRQQEALEKERARIARDLHDQLGANLTQVALLGELAESDKELPGEVEAHARQISQTARETTRALDEIVWTVNPSNDTLDGLINYVCKYAQEYLALAGLRYRLEVPPALPSRPISPELRHNAFLAAKEAVNNVVKHSKATSAWLKLQLHPDHFVLEIEDDGQGLKAADERKGRNGLRNMRRRMEDVGGRFETTAREGGGTIIRLIAPLEPESADGKAAR
jgi:ligand-binding sensor domain-containing protein/signal transduction histidine kinase